MGDVSSVGLSARVAGALTLGIVSLAAIAPSASHAAGGPTVTVEQAADQADPSPDWNIRFEVTFSEPVTGFDEQDVVMTLTPGMEATPVVTGADAVYVVTVVVSKGYGAVSVSVPPGAALSASNVASDGSTSADNTVDWTSPGLPLVTATVEQAADQPDPTTVAEVRFDIVFSEPVQDFGTADLDVGGTAAPDNWSLTTSDDTSWVVTVRGMSQSGTVTVAVPAGVVWTSGRNTNEASTSTDNTVTYDNDQTVTTPGGGVTVAITEGGSLASVVWSNPSVAPPKGWRFPWGELSFAADVVDGGEFVTFVITLPSEADGYFKLEGSTWNTFAWDGTTGAVVSGNTITVRIQDNGRGDDDPTLGSVSDPAAPAVLSGQLVTTGADTTPLLQLSALLVLLGAAFTAASRRRTA